MGSIQDNLNAFLDTTGLSIQDATGVLATGGLPVGAVDTDVIENDAVTTAKIDDGTIINDDIALGVYQNAIAKIAPIITPTEFITDGGFANWDDPLTPDSWEVSSNEDETDYTKTIRSTDVHGGTYSVSSEAYMAYGGTYLGNTLVPDTAFTVDQTIQASLWAKKTAGNGTVFILYAYDSGEDTYNYNFTGVDAGTWTIDGGGPTSDQLYPCTPGDGVYAQTVAPLATAPAAGVDDGYIAFISNGDDGDIVLIDDIDVEIDSVSSITNGTFEAWSNTLNEEFPLEDWDYQKGAFWDDGYVSQSASANGGTYAVTITVPAVKTGYGGYIWQTIAGTAGDSIDLSVYTKTTNSKTGYMILLDGEVAAQTQEWDFVANTWDTQQTTVTDLPGTSNALTLSGTGSYVENTETATFPASGNIIILLMTDDGDGGPNVYDFDMVTGIVDVESGGNDYVGLKGYSLSDSDDFEDTDELLLVETSSGTTTDVLKILADGQFSIINNLVDFKTAGTDIKVQTATLADHPVSKTYLESNLSPLTIVPLGSVSVDYKTEAQYDLSYTVPTGYKLISAFTTVETTVATAPNLDGAASIGTTGGSWVDAVSSVPGASSTVGNVTMAFLSGTTAIAAGGILKVNVGTADTGTALNATVTLFGYIIAV